MLLITWVNGTKDSPTTASRQLLEALIPAMASLLKVNTTSIKLKRLPALAPITASLRTFSLTALVVGKSLQGIHDTYRFNSTAIRIIHEHAAKYGVNDVPLYLYLAFNSPHAPIEVDEGYYNLYPQITYPLQKTFYGMVTEVDYAVGDVVKALKKTGLWENTLFVYASDNGSPVSPTKVANQG